MQQAREPSIIKSDDIYECLACGKMYTEDALYKHCLLYTSPSP